MLLWDSVCGSQEIWEGWLFTQLKNAGRKLLAAEMSPVKLMVVGRKGSSYMGQKEMFAQGILNASYPLISHDGEKGDREEEKEKSSITSIGVWGKVKVRLPPPLKYPHPMELKPGFKRRIKHNEDMDRWFLFISTTEEINVTLIM